MMTKTILGTLNREPKEEILRVRQDMGKLSHDLREAKDAVATLKDAPDRGTSSESLGTSSVELQEQVRRLSALGEVPERLAERLRGVEERVEASRTAGDGAVDEQVRLEVQRQVKELSTKIESELGTLDGHQKDLVDTKASI